MNEKIVTTVESIEIAMQSCEENKEIVRNMSKKKRKKYGKDVMSMLDGIVREGKDE